MDKNHLKIQPGLHMSGSHADWILLGRSFAKVRTDLESLQPCSSNFMPLSQSLAAQYPEIRNLFEKATTQIHRIQTQTPQTLFVHRFRF